MLASVAFVAGTADATAGSGYCSHEETHESVTHFDSRMPSVIHVLSLYSQAEITPDASAPGRWPAAQRSR